MINVYKNTLGSERTVELEFMKEILSDRCDSTTKILDVGGIPSTPSQMRDIFALISRNNLNYKVADFRGGEFQGDFVTYDFGNHKFDLIIFLSSLEHFPQCTESDCEYREGEDRRGFEKALSILNDGGYILLTVPFGKHRWQPYHQNYDWDGILELTKGSKIISSHIYRLKDNNWVLEPDPSTMKDVLYTDRAFGCGCFLLQK